MRACAGVRACMRLRMCVPACACVCVKTTDIIFEAHRQAMFYFSESHPKQAQ